MEYSERRVADRESPINGTEINFKDWFVENSSGDIRELSRGEAVLNAFGRIDGRMRMLVGYDGTFLVGCSGISNLFEMGSCLRLANGTLSVIQPEYHDDLQKLLRVSGPDVVTLALPCRMTDGHLLLRATPMCKGVTCLSVQQATEFIQPELPDLEAVFNLTKTEALIVSDLFRGHTPQQIAEFHDNSIHTVRAHIRRCYDKLGITCREELWRKLNAYHLS